MNKAQTEKTKDTEVAAPRKVYKKIPGQQDFLAEETRDIEFLLTRFRKLAAGFGFSLVEPSLFEFHENHKKFHNKEGRPEKLKTADGNDIALRTNGLSGLLRMYVEGRVHEKEGLSKWYYIVPTTVKHDNPYQLVTSREYGLEVIGDESAVYDAQILALTWKFYSVLGEDKVVLEIGSRGCADCWPEYQETLKRNFIDAKYSLCKNCALSVEENPEKILRCEEASCQSIAADSPAFIDYLDDACSSHLTAVLESLEELKVPYVLLTTSQAEACNKRTVFKFRFNHPQDSFVLSEGSRHDALFDHFEEEPRPALGMSGDLGRLLRAWHLSGGTVPEGRQADVALIPLGDLGAKKSLSLFSHFWDESFSVINLFDDNSLKARLTRTAELKVPVALIIGQKEALEDTVILRDVKSGMQEVFTADRILSEVKKRLGE